MLAVPEVSSFEKPPTEHRQQDVQLLRMLQKRRKLYLCVKCEAQPSLTTPYSCCHDPACAPLS